MTIGPPSITMSGMPRRAISIVRGYAYHAQRTHADLDKGNAMSDKVSFEVPGKLISVVARANAARWQKLEINWVNEDVWRARTEENTHGKNKEFLNRVFATPDPQRVEVSIQSSADRGDTWDSSDVKITSASDTEVVVASEDGEDRDRNDCVVKFSWNK